MHTSCSWEMLPIFIYLSLLLHLLFEREDRKNICRIIIAK